MDTPMTDHLTPALPFPVLVEPSAIAQLEVLSVSENTRPRLRIAIEGGGCSGFLYRFDFDEESGEDDLSARFGDVEVVIDPLSALYLQGSTLSYVEDFGGGRLVMRNPIATSTCGCGSSFAA
jgi:iron-sulfur cluster insertion protein